MSDTPSTETLESTLRSQLATLEARRARIDNHQQNRHNEPSQDWTERAAELNNEEVVEALAAKTDAEIHAVRRALERLVSGDALLCEGCDEPIDPRRLAILPETTVCARCAI